MATGLDIGTGIEMRAPLRGSVIHAHERRERTSKCACLRRCLENFKHDPAVEGLQFHGMEENPFHKELAHGEEFEFGVGDHDDEPTIRLQMRLVRSPWMRILLALLTCCISEIFYRFQLWVYSNETRLALTNRGRILIFSNSVRGTGRTFLQAVSNIFVSNLTILPICVAGTVGVVYKSKWDNGVILIAGAVFCLLRFAQALYTYLNERLTVKSNTLMRSFMAADLCATSFVLYHRSGFCCFWYKTVSEVRLFFGRYPPANDMSYQLSRHAPNVDLIRTNPSQALASSEESESGEAITESSTEDSSPPWLAAVIVAQSIAYWLTFGNWATAVFHFSFRGGQIPDPITTVGVIADFIAFVVTARVLIRLAFGNSMKQKPIVYIRDEIQSGCRSAARDEAFVSHVPELIGFLAKMAKQAVCYGKGFRPPLPRVFPGVDCYTPRSKSTPPSTWHNIIDIGEVPYSENWKIDLESKIKTELRKYSRPQLIVRDCNNQDLGLAWFGNSNWPELRLVPTRRSFPLQLKAHRYRGHDVFHKIAPLSIHEMTTKVRGFLRDCEPHVSDFCMNSEPSVEEEVMQKCSEFVTLIEPCPEAPMGEVILAVYPYSGTSRWLHTILTYLTCGIYYIMFKLFLIPHTYGAVIVTNARIIQVSVRSARWNWGLKIDTYILDNSLWRSTIDVPTPLPCSCGSGESHINLLTRLGELQIRLPRTQWYEEFMYRVWSTLSVVTTSRVDIEKDILGDRRGEGNREFQVYPLDSEPPKWASRWHHLMLTLAQRLEMKILWPLELDEDACGDKAYTFTGKMGVECNEEGVVRKVIEYEPAHKEGITAGDNIRIVKVDADPYSREVLARAESRGSNYTVVVRKNFPFLFCNKEDNSIKPLFRLKQFQDAFTCWGSIASILPPTLGHSRPFSCSNSNGLLIADLGSLGEISGQKQFDVTAWLRIPKEYLGDLLVKVSQPTCLVCVLWSVADGEEWQEGIAKNWHRLNNDFSSPSMRASATPQAYFIGDRVRVRDKGDMRWHKGIVTSVSPFLKVTIVGGSAGVSWDEVKQLQASPLTDADGKRCVCYMIEIPHAKLLHIPERPCHATFFAGDNLWDMKMELGYKEPKKVAFPRAANEEILWSTSLTHERPDFLWMKVDVPEMHQTWSITSHRLITVKDQPLTNMQMRIRRCCPWFATPPRRIITFLPLSSLAGYSAQETQTFQTSCLKQCWRRYCGRDEDDKKIITMKLLTRIGAKRTYPDGAAITQLVYWEPEKVSSGFYHPEIREFRAWATAFSRYNNGVLRLCLVPAGNRPCVDKLWDELACQRILLSELRPLANYSVPEEPSAAVQKCRGWQLRMVSPSDLAPDRMQRRYTEHAEELNDVTPTNHVAYSFPEDGRWGRTKPSSKADAFIWEVPADRITGANKGDEVESIDFKLKGVDSLFRLRYWPKGQNEALAQYCSLFLWSKKSVRVQIELYVNEKSQRINQIEEGTECGYKNFCHIPSGGVTIKVVLLQTDKGLAARRPPLHIQNETFQSSTHTADPPGVDRTRLMHDLEALRTAAYKSHHKKRANEIILEVQSFCKSIGEDVGSLMNTKVEGGADDTQIHEVEDETRISDEEGTETNAN